jgi:hypothetical protein
MACHQKLRVSRAPPTPQREDPDSPELDEKESAMKGIVTAVAWVMFVTATVGVAAAQGPPQFTLTGVVVVEGGGRAWLQEPQLTQNQPIAMRPGETIGSYRLTKILEDRVELVGPGGPISVLLAGVSGPAAPAAMAPPPPPRMAEPVSGTGPDRVVILPPGPPLAPLPPNTPRVDFGSLLQGIQPH